MRHASTGELRRLSDDALAVRDETRLHVRACGRCARRQARMAQDAVAVHGVLPDLPTANIGTDVAWARFRRRADAGDGAEVPAPRRARFGPGRRRVALAAAGSAVLLVATTAAATEVVSILTPAKVAPVQLGAGDLSSLLKALPSATLTQTDGGATERVGSLSEAEAATGLALKLPGRLPSGVALRPSFTVQPQVTMRLAFRSATGTPSIGRAPVPQWLAGSTLTIQAGPAVLVTYPADSGPSGVPGLVVAYSAAPVVTATGASPQSIEDYVLSQPGVSSSLAAEIRMLGAPGTVLPVPVPAGATVGSATVGGSPAVVLSDPSGFGAGVIWERGGTVGLVAGLVSAKEAKAVADELG